MLRISVVLFGVLLSASAAAAAVEDACAIPGQTFASCSAQNRNFHSVLLAVPGWHGTCSDTFGKGAQSLFTVLKDGGGQRSFFDIDCFNYDSDNVTLPNNEILLRAQLQKLRDYGYDRIMLVTHSTGGVLALRLLLDDMLAPDRKSLRAAPGSPVFDNQRGAVTAVDAWAAPINGLRGWVNIGQTVANWLTHFSPEVLPDLKPDSDWLKSLRSDLATFYTLYKDAPGPQRALFGFQLLLLQGNSNDDVIAPVPPDDAWLKIVPSQTEFVLTGLGHTHNISESMDAGAELFPGELMKDKTKFHLNLSPRLDVLFSAQTDTIPKDLADRQLLVVDGVMSYINTGLLPGISGASAFFKTVLTDKFGRSEQLDTKVAGDFSRLVEQKVVDADEADKPIIFRTVLDDVADLYDPTKPASVQAFGQGKSAAAKAMLDLVQFIFDQSRQFLARNPDKGNEVDQLNSRVMRLQARYLDAPGAVQVAAEKYFNLNVPRLSVAAVASSDTVRIWSEHAQKTAGLLTPDRQKIIGDTIVALSRVAPDAGRRSFFTDLVQTVPTPEGDQPLWTRVLNNSQAVDLAKVGGQVSEQQFDFITDVVKQAGSTGNSTVTAKAAIDAAVAATLANPTATAAWTSQLKAAGQAAPIPSIDFAVRQSLSRANLQ